MYEKSSLAMTSKGFQGVIEFDLVSFSNLVHTFSEYPNDVTRVTI